MNSDKYTEYTNMLVDEFEKIKEKIDISKCDLTMLYPYMQIYVIHNELLTPIINSLSAKLNYTFSICQIERALAEVIINRTPH